MRFSTFASALTVVCGTLWQSPVPVSAATGTPRPLAGATSTSLTADGRLLVNGRPYFFIGTAPGPPLHLETPEGEDGWAELAEGGINVVRSNIPIDNDSTVTAGQLREYMDNAAEHGVWVWPYIRNLISRTDPRAPVQLRSFIEQFRSHPAVFFWKSSDEPAWGKIPAERLRKAYGIMRETDPDHLVWITHAPRGTTESLRPYSAAADALAIDIYPVSVPPGKHSLEANKGLSMVGDYTRRTVELAWGGKLPFMILQAGWSGVSPRHNPKNRLMFPTFREERFMMYQAIINGANSLSFFGLTVGLTGRDEELGFNWTWWRAVLRPLLAEIRKGSELYPVLLAPDTTCPLEFSGAPQIEARWKEAGVYLYIFAAAREGSTQEVRFSGLQDGEVAVLFENRTLEAKGGSFTDTFAEHDVHVYRALRKLPPLAGGGAGRGDAETTGTAEGSYYAPPGAR